MKIIDKIKSVEPKKIVVGSIVTVLVATTAITTPIAFSKRNDFTSETHKAQAETTMAINSVEKVTTTITVANPTTTKSNTTVVKSIAPETNTTTSANTTTTIAERKIKLNQKISDNNGNYITFTGITVNENWIMIDFYSNLPQNGKTIKGYDLTYVSNSGLTMSKPEGYGTKYGCAETNAAMLAPDPSITSITASYTFPDGTTSSAVLNLN